MFLTGDPTSFTREKYGTYADLFRVLLGEEGDVWRVFDAREFTFPEPASEFEAVIVTGSASDAHGDEPWIYRLNEAIRDVFQERKKILGVCFGHQAVANALGGQSGRNGLGWELGCRSLTLHSAFKRRTFTSGIDTLKILEIHRDHVTRIPPGAEVLASTPKAPVQVYALDDTVLGIQGHPEFNNDILRDLVEGRAKDGMIDPDTAREALDTLRLEQDVDAWRLLIRRFLRET